MSRSMIHRYPLRAMAPDYARAGLGLAGTGALLLGTDPSAPAATVFAALAILFAALGVQAALRHRAAVQVSDEGIRASPRGDLLPWGSLSDLRLGYFSLRRDGRRGWMELKLGYGRHTLRLDSRLEGFAEVVGHAAREAGRAGVALDHVTVENLRILEGGVVGNQIGERSR